jgi:DNA invertase Pin-like site-specific DNA recombinase
MVADFVQPRMHEMSQPPNQRFIAYYRVSTARQGRSGLGLEAQRAAVTNYLRGVHPLQEFTEIESGRKNQRPMLAEALVACRLQSAVLIIAKLDRLARNVAFVSNLLESGVEFIAVDFPQANRLTIHILAAVAEYEARLISERTRAALAAAKERGANLGGFRGRSGTVEDCTLATVARVEKADQRARDLHPLLIKLRSERGLSLAAIATELNARGITAPRGGRWIGSQVRRTILRST